MPTYKEPIGARIRRLRKAKKLNGRQLARHIGIDPATLSKLENGRSQPSPTTIEKLAEFFGTSLDELVQGSPAPAATGIEDDPNKARDSTTERTSEASGTTKQDFGFSAAISAQVYATLAALFAELAADLEFRAAPHAIRETAASRRTARSSGPTTR